MKTVEEQKQKLQEKKTKLLLKETKIKLKERKMRTRKLIEIGGLVVKAQIDYLPTNTLYGALISLANQIEKEGEQIKNIWTKIGADAFNSENKNKTAIVVKFNDEPSAEIRESIRSLALKYNSIRKEWYGYVQDLEYLKDQIKNTKHQLELIS